MTCDNNNYDVQTCPILLCLKGNLQKVKFFFFASLVFSHAQRLNKEHNKSNFRKNFKGNCE